MKTSKVLMVLATLGFLSFAQVNDPEKNILGRWKIDASSLAKTSRAVIETTRKTKPDVAEQMDANFEQVMDFVSKTEYEFTADHVYRLKTAQNTQEGKWELADNGRSLVVIREGKPNRKDSIVELTPTRLILINKERGDTTLYIHP